MMKVRVLLFAALRERLGKSELECDVKPGESVSQLAERILGFNRNVLFAVNDQFADKEHVVSDGDTVAFIPPMAGG